MDTNHVTVVYRWTAQAGEARRARRHLPRGHGGDGTERARRRGGPRLRVGGRRDAVYVRDEFADAGAVAFHLQQTAAAHFPDLLAVATPGPFFFMGDLPDELKQATEQMQLGGEFSTHLAGFDR